MGTLRGREVKKNVSSACACCWLRWQGDSRKRGTEDLDGTHRDTEHVHEAMDSECSAARGCPIKYS